MDISADNLEYLAKDNIYIATGSVQIIYKGATLHADKIHFNNSTADAAAVGNVIYEDKDVVIEGDKIELNLDSRIGTIYNSKIFYKEHNYHIYGGNLKKLGDKTYSMDTADATTCDALPPEWHFKGDDIKITLHENIKARNARFYIRNIPVLYSPYFWAPLVEKRQTGFLVPSIGYSRTKGFTFKQGFFWAVRDDMDATFYADYYSKKGIGKGFDYRYIADPETRSELWIYHLRDNDLLRDFSEFKSFHTQKIPYDMSGYLKIHIVNEFDYYDVLESTSSNRTGFTTLEPDPFGTDSEERLQKFLESNLHLSKPFTGGRTYLSGQYRQSIEGSSGTIPQSLPEVGFIINTRNIGSASFNMAVTGTNFWRSEGQQGQRLDFYPNVYLSVGRTVNFTQKLGLRETLYFLENPTENASREIFDLSTILSTRFLKRYASFIHIIEPSIEYVYVPDVAQNNIPTFDSMDFMPETSDIIYSFTNRLAGFFSDNSGTRLRFSQRYSLLDEEKTFSPILIEAKISSRYLNFSANSLFDVYDMNITETIASLDVKGEKSFVGVGKSFRRSTSLDQYSLKGGIHSPVEVLGKSIPMNIFGKLWFDLKGGGVQQLELRSTYMRQCWALTVSYSQKPSEYQIRFGIQFKGFQSIKIGKLESFSG